MKKRLLFSLALLTFTVAACTSNESGIKDTPEPAEVSPKDINQEEMLSAKVLNILNSEEYTMEYRIISNDDPNFHEDENNMFFTTTIVSPDQTATIYHTDDKDVRTVQKDDTLYTIDDENESIIVSPVRESQLLKNPIGEGEPELIKKGEEKFQDTLYSVEAFEYKNRTTKFYFDGTHIVGWELMKNNYTTIIEIKSLTDKIDESMFELPEEYTEVEMDI